MKDRPGRGRPEGVPVRHTRNGKEAAEVCRPVTRNGKRYRGLNALAQKDHALLLALSRGEFALTSIRNADLRALLITVLIAACNADDDNLLKWPHENPR